MPIDKSKSSPPKQHIGAVQVGDIRVFQLNGKTWLANEIGEAMVANEIKLAATLRRFFRKNF